MDSFTLQNLLQLVCMDDYGKEYFMVQGFTTPGGPGQAGALLAGPANSEFVSEVQQGESVFLTAL